MTIQINYIDNFLQDIQERINWLITELNHVNGTEEIKTIMYKLQELRHIQDKYYTLDRKERSTKL